MIIYLAGVNSENFAEVAYGANILTTYWETKKWKDGVLGQFRRRFAFNRVFLDCGAYSAWTSGQEVDIDRYCSFLHRNMDGATEYPQLDVKGDYQKTRDNLLYMERQGLTPMPVFHMRDTPIDYFKELVDKGHTRIALGAMAGEKGLDKDLVDSKLRTIFAYITDKETGVVKVKLHAFGQTGIDILLKYPFYSADSTSWLGGAKYGSVIVFDWKDGKLKDVSASSKLYKNAFLRIDPRYRSPRFTHSKGGKTYVRRLVLGRLAYEDAEKYITAVWKQRGISFIDET